MMKVAKTLCVTFLAAVLLGVFSLQAYGASVFFDDTAKYVNTNSNFDLKIYANSGAYGILGYDMNITYDPSQMELLTTTPGTGFDSVPSIVPGGLVAGLTISPDYNGDDQLLADLTFKCLAVGISDIGVSYSDLQGILLVDQYDPIFSAIEQPQVALAVITQGAASVPEPGTLLLACSGLAGLIALKRKSLG